jgi:uncharacterized membrane protein YccF (DUF307 family)
MNAFGNILWIFLGGGIFIFLQYLIGGLILCLTFIGIPFGLQAFRLAGLSLAPFGKEVVYAGSQTGCIAGFLNILWIVVGGVWIALTHVVFAVLMALTLIGIPFAMQHMKLATFAFTPFAYQLR